MAEPFFSVVIPTYNHAHLISDCIQSIIDQTFSNWEAIVVNNYSEDNTIEVVNKFGDARIQIVNIHNDGVIAKSRNVGISRAKGEWICLLDSDDSWAPNKLERVYSQIIEGDFDVICHSMLLINQEKEVLRKMECGCKSDNMYRDFLLDGNRVQNSSVCVKKSFLNKHNLLISENPDFSGAEDYDFMMQLALRNAKFAFLGESLGYYLVNGNNFSMSDKFFSHLESVLHYHVFDIHAIDGSPKKNWNYIYARLSLKRGNSSYHKKKLFTGIKYWIEALCRSPKACMHYFKNRLNLLYKQ